MQFDYTDLINAARRNDENAFEMLYTKSISGLKKIAFKYLKNANDANDALQETYLSIYNKLDTLDKPNAFPDWAKMICRNTCLNMIRKSGRIYSNELSTQPITDDDGIGLDMLSPQDYRIEYNPEMSIDQNENKRLISVILDDLPEAQRTCILLWQEQNSTKEISLALGMSEGTVKSNVHYAKKKIKEKVLMLEKQGTKLYGLAPIPFFLWLMGQFDKVAEMEAPASGIAGSYTSIKQAVHTAVQSNVGTGTIITGKNAANAGKVTAAKATTAVGGAALSKGAIAAIIAAVTAGGILGGYAVYSSATGGSSGVAISANSSNEVETGLDSDDAVKPVVTKKVTPEPTQNPTSAPESTPEPTPEPEEKQIDYISQYAEVFTELEEQYGEADIVYADDEMVAVPGMSFAKIVDFDNDSMQELVTMHMEMNGSELSETIDVWGIDENGEVINLFNQERNDLNNIYNEALNFIDKDNKVYLQIGTEITGDRSSSGIWTLQQDYGSVEDGKFIVHSYKENFLGDVDQGKAPFVVDGTEVSEEEFNKVFPGYKSDSGEYLKNENIYHFYWYEDDYYFPNITTENSKAVFDQLNETKKLLGLTTGSEYVYETKYFTFTMPEYWRGKVTIVKFPNGGLGFYCATSIGDKGICGIGIVDASEPNNLGDISSAEIWSETSSGKRIELSRTNYLWLIPNDELNGYDEGWSDDDKELLIDLSTGGKYNLASARAAYEAKQAEGISIIDDEFYDNEVIPNIVVKRESTAEWQSAYAAFLRNAGYAEQFSNEGQDLCFNVLDINDDGISELLIGNSDAHLSGLGVYTFYNGQVGFAGWAPGCYGETQYYPETNTLFAEVTHDGSDLWTAVQLESGKLVELEKYGSYIDENGVVNRDESGILQFKYKCTDRGQEISEEEFNQKIEQLCTGECISIFYPGRSGEGGNGSIVLVPINEDNIIAYLESN